MGCVMIQKIAVAAIVILLVLTIPADCLACVVVSANNAGSFDEHAVSVRPGDTFSIDINVSAAEEIFNVHGMTLMASGPPVLQVTGGRYRNPWTSYGSLPLGEVDPASSPFDVILPYPEYFGPGESTLATLDILVDANAPTDLLTLNVVDGTYDACWYCLAFWYAQSGPDFLVDVVPEPTSILLLAGGALLLARRRSALGRLFA